MKRTTDYVSPQQMEYSEDEELVHAMARQYVLDAEAAGSASPSHRSRKNTNKSLGDTDMPATSSSEEPPPRLPALKHSLAAAGYDMPEKQYSMEKQPSHGVYVVRSTESSSDNITQEEENDEGRGTGSGRALSDRLRSEEVEDDAYEAKFFVPTRMRYPPPKYLYSADGSVPVGMVLFLLGFILLPLWWIGAVFPRKPNSDIVRTWRKYNALMTLLSLPLLGLFLALGGWQAVHG
ncbi:hypothetical protein J3B02_005919 [Coemansia erecta]|uniref:Uncharacterized protein n=1 Tax=Coemansia asiatica TaxID=1052880 RepID=A0A9W7XPL3_9FUNG|nr:hypothetical protein LPJ64_001153 [Coemansia asiatica]KAJ2841349.1 hypothetical protein J3B02_005919 [Coemansia erecta]KAJ2887628.1 hypothetical protein FB639_001178 [Coemansia asiatica]